MLKKHLETYYFIAFALLGLFPIVPFIVKPFLIVPLILISLINLFVINKSKKNWKSIFISTSIFLIFVISASYSNEKDLALKLLIRLTPLMMLPIGFAMVPTNIYNKVTSLFIKIFVTSCSLFCILIFIYINTLNSSDLLYIYSHMSNEFWGYEAHPIYISLYLGIALILIFLKQKKTIFNVSLFIIILFTLLFLSRKGNIISLGIILLFMAILNFKNFVSKKAIVCTLGGLLIVIGVNFLFNNFLFVRFKEIANLSQFLNNTESSTGIRSIVWRICLSLSIDSPFWGYGLGATQTLIDAGLIESGYKKLTLVHRYNAHNQYLQIVLSSGYIGLLFFLSILVYLFRKYKNRHNKLALCVFLYILFCFLFESLLERQNGIIITALFFNLFLFLPQKKEIINE